MRGKLMTGKALIRVMPILMVLMMTVLDVTVVNVALPVLAEELRVSDSDAVWIVTIYQLVITMLLLPVSAIGDRYSYRKTFLAGVAVFSLGSLCCAAADNFYLIVAARGLQGVGAACVMGVNIALTRIIYPREILGRGLALNAMVIAVATAAGPTLAGAILSFASWHWLFLINIPFGLAAFFIGRKTLPSNPERKQKERFDLKGAYTNALAFGLLFVALACFSDESHYARGLALLVVALGATLYYINHERKFREPMLPLDLFRSRLYSMSISTSTCSFVAQNMAMISLPFLFHNSFGFNPIMTGALMTPWSIATLLTAPVGARIAEKYNPARTAAAGMAVYAAGLVLLIRLAISFPETATETTPDHILAWDIAWRMALCGLGFGLFQTPNNLVMVMATPIHRTGSAGGMQSTARLVGQTFGATLVSIIFAHIPLIFPVKGNRIVDSISTTSPIPAICALSASLLFAVAAGWLTLSRSKYIK